MKQLIDSIHLALANKNWYAAITITLILPDICGKLERPSEKSETRYVDWFNRYIQPKYTAQIGAQHQTHVFLSGNDCYALRCAYLHEGSDDIVEQKARKALERFVFVSPPPGSIIHCNQPGNKLQLQVDIFCKDLCEGVERWLSDIKNDATILNRMNRLLTIYSFEKGFSF